MKLIGLGHKKRQGKDTVAGLLIETFPEIRFERIAFADAVKIECYDILDNVGDSSDLFWNALSISHEFWDLPHPPVYLEERETSIQEKLDWSEANRAILVPFWQYYGTDYRRKQDPDYWANAAHKRLEASTADVALITDVRFFNEVDLIRSWHGFCVKVSRTGYTDPAPSTHPSETTLDSYRGWDYEICAANLDQLKERALRVFDDLMKDRPHA